ncbi:hypothetical protein [Brevundimonas sp. TWP2-3-4b1]|uniref:hypothetical protein n=1 Tax=Brevundimonas sp. TWP2-3-4b1 TaxID=2804580 RepID=UPI003CE9E4E3
MTPAFSATARRARILRATRTTALTLSEIVRRTRPRQPFDARDDSLQRLKTTSAIRALKADRLMTRTRDGWSATPEGVRVLAQLEARN